MGGDEREPGRKQVRRNETVCSSWPIGQQQSSSVISVHTLSPPPVVKCLNHSDKSDNVCVRERGGCEDAEFMLLVAMLVSVYVLSTGFH